MCYAVIADHYDNSIHTSDFKGEKKIEAEFFPLDQIHMTNWLIWDLDTGVSDLQSVFCHRPTFFWKKSDLSRETEIHSP